MEAPTEVDEPIVSGTAALTTAPTFQRSLEMERLAVSLRKSRPGDPAYTLTTASAGKQRCYYRDPGPPETLEQIPCDIIVIVDDDD